MNPHKFNFFVLKKNNPNEKNNELKKYDKFHSNFLAMAD